MSINKLLICVSMLLTCVSLVVLLVLFVGRGQSKEQQVQAQLEQMQAQLEQEQTQLAQLDQAYAQLEQKAEKLSKAHDKMQQEEEALRKQLAADPRPVVDLAIERMKAAAAENYGDEAAKVAKITATKAGVKTFGPDKWTVTGSYDRPDQADEKIKTDWTATIELMFGLQCTNIKMGEH